MPAKGCGAVDDDTFASDVAWVLKLMDIGNSPKSEVEVQDPQAISLWSSFLPKTCAKFTCSLS